MGTISVVFGSYEFVSTPDVFFDTLSQRIIFVLVCIAMVSLRSGSRWTWLAPWLGAAFVMAMFVMMEGIVAASDPTKPIYPFNGLTLLGPAAALLLPLQLRHGVVMVAFILFGHAAVGMLGWQARQAVLADELFVLAAASLITLVAVQVTDSLRWRVFRSNHLLELEKARSEQLLLNVLPATIAQRLKESDGAIAAGFGRLRGLGGGRARERGRTRRPPSVVVALAALPLGVAAPALGLHAAGARGSADSPLAPRRRRRTQGLEDHLSDPRLALLAVGFAAAAAAANDSQYAIAGHPIAGDPGEAALDGVAELVAAHNVEAQLHLGLHLVDVLPARATGAREAQLQPAIGDAQA
jgi:hypothetical protein